VGDNANWEPLADAMRRVMLAGITEDEAQLALCRAISNRKSASEYIWENWKEATSFSIKQCGGRLA
jgi:hypothetical protein